MKIPIVFAFDDNYALPASIAIQSLLDSKHKNTEYEIIVFHNGLKRKTIKKMEKITPIRWIKVDKNLLKDVPRGWSGLETYYRLLIADLLPEYNKVLWSDVDVLFCGDLSDIYKQNLEDADWGGIIAEKQNEKHGVHPHYSENKKPYIYMPGFMVINTKLWRKKQMWTRFMNIIQKYGSRLRFFDLDILNLAADKIYPVPFEYCVLENIYDAQDIKTTPEYPWLKRAQGEKTLLNAKNNPIIIHYAGKDVKIWKRFIYEIPEYYWKYIIQSPFYNKNDYRWTALKEVTLRFQYFLLKIVFIKKWRRGIKQKIYDLEIERKGEKI